MITLALIIYKNTRKRNPPLLMHTCDSSSTWKKVQVNFHFYPISTEEDFYSELFTITAPSATAVAPNANTYVKYLQKTTTKAAQNTYQHNKKRLIRKNEFTSKVCGTTVRRTPIVSRPTPLLPLVHFLSRDDRGRSPSFSCSFSDPPLSLISSVIYETHNKRRLI